MARFLWCIWPLGSHLGPQMGTALALRQRGHEVVFYSGESLRPLVEPHGLGLHPFRRVPDGLATQMLQEMERPRAFGALRRPYTVSRVMRRWYVETLRDQVSDLNEIIADWQPDVLVTETSIWAPFLILGETHQLPVALSSTLMACLLPGPQAPPWGLGLPRPDTVPTRALAALVQLGVRLGGRSLRRQVDAIRAEYGLPSLDCTVTEVTGRLPLYLVPGLRELDYNRTDLPPSVHYTGACIWNSGTQPAHAAWLDAIPTDRPWVHVTEGTAHFQDPFVLRTAAEALADLPVEVVMTTGAARDPHTLDLGRRAPNIWVGEWASHAELLPRCAAMITTGGAGSVLAALQVGVPLVVVPTNWDKPDNAQRLVSAGVGIRLWPWRCTPARLRQALVRLLEDPSYGASARGIADRLRAEPGPAGAASLLEALAPRASQTPPSPTLATA